MPTSAHLDMATARLKSPRPAGALVRPVLAFLLVAVLVAGCSSNASNKGGVDAASESATATLANKSGGTCGVRGVIVDQAIRPVSNATVTLSGANVNKTATTKSDGIFEFGNLQPGGYFLRVSHLLYSSVQGAVDCRAGEVATPKLQVQRLFSQDPYHETQKFDGFLQCAWAVEGAASSTCVNDYTHFVGLGYTCPQCEHLFDSRGTTYPLGGGWQTQVYEVIWEPSAQGTSPEMRITVSHFPRPATHWYCSGTGPSPILLRIELNVTCEDQQDTPALQPPEGELNTTMFMAAKAPDGQPAALAFSQRFSVFMNFFYYGKPPEGWSFVAGDPYPF
jgi:hypothetical protein